MWPLENTEDILYYSALIDLKTHPYKLRIKILGFTYMSYGVFLSVTIQAQGVLSSSLNIEGTPRQDKYMKCRKGLIPTQNQYPSQTSFITLLSQIWKLINTSYETKSGALFACALERYGLQQCKPSGCSHVVSVPRVPRGRTNT